MSKRLEFSRKTRARRFEHCKGKCEGCGVKLVPGKFDYHHEKEAEDGGDNSFENCRVLCDNCHAPLTKAFIRRIRKADRQRDRNIGALKPKRSIPRRPKEPRVYTKTLPPRRHIQTGERYD